MTPRDPGGPFPALAATVLVSTAGGVEVCGEGGEEREGQEDEDGEGEAGAGLGV